MEQIKNTSNEVVTKNYFYRFLSFHGNGGDLFKLTIVNLLLTIVTLGLYYPWSKAAKLKYLYSQTSFKNSRFNFLGTGKEMFRGFIKIYLGIVLVYAFLIYAEYSKNQTLLYIAVAIIYGALIFLIPFAIHGALRYRMSRTSWRSIRFGYRGKAMELFKKYIIGFFLTIITLGIYGSWFTIDLYQYLYSKMRFGDIELRYKGNGLDYFLLNLKGLLLTIVTCYIYIFWYQKEVFEYHTRNTELIQNGRVIPLNTQVSGGDFFQLTIVNILILMFTLGLGMPWVVCRTMEFYCANTLLEEDIDENALKQTEDKYTNATGEDLLDYADLDLGLLDF